MVFLDNSFCKRILDTVAITWWGCFVPSCQIRKRLFDFKMTDCFLKTQSYRVFMLLFSQIRKCRCKIGFLALPDKLSFDPCATLPLLGDNFWVKRVYRREVLVTFWCVLFDVIVARFCTWDFQYYTIKFSFFLLKNVFFPQMITYPSRLGFELWYRTSVR